MNVFSIANPKNLNKVLFLFFCLLSSSALAQTPVLYPKDKVDFKLHKKGHPFFNWGYNRSWFNKSDIHFTGQGHDFVLYDVKASDRPSELSFVYINPTTWSIPQFNLRIGYFISDRYSVSIGWDHMKYVAIDYQTVKMSGHVDPSMVSDELIKTNMEHLNATYSASGVYNNITVQMTPDDFIRYEHTDGLNYASIDMERYDPLWQCKKYNKIGISLVSGVGAGLIIPRTDSHLFGSGRNHYWNVSGWGVSPKIGLQINLTKRIYLKSDFKFGYLRMQNVRSNRSSQDR